MCVQENHVLEMQQFRAKYIKTEWKFSHPESLFWWESQTLSQLFPLLSKLSTGTKSLVLHTAPFNQMEESDRSCRSLSSMGTHRSPPLLDKAFIAHWLGIQKQAHSSLLCPLSVLSHLSSQYYKYIHGFLKLLGALASTWGLLVLSQVYLINAINMHYI